MTCPQCGTELLAGSNGCQACGWGAKLKLQLQGAASTLSTAIELTVGKVLASKICGEDAKYMDDIQFKLKTRDDCWFIKPWPRVKNPTYVNGLPISSEVQLNDGDRISLKDKAAFIDVHIS